MDEGIQVHEGRMRHGPAHSRHQRDPRSYAESGSVAASSQSDVVFTSTHFLFF